MIFGPILAMGRPRRPQAEADLVRSAGLPAAELAREVAKATIVDLDMASADPFLAAAAELARQSAQSPVLLLATSPTIDTAAMAKRIRLRRFEARGCTHLPEREWAAEKRQVEVELSECLARRYSRLLRNISR